MSNARLLADLVPAGLDIVEEGTWTPKIYGNDVEMTSPNAVSGQYVRTGNLIFLSFFFFKAMGSGSGSPPWEVRNLPFSGYYYSSTTGAYQSLTAGYCYISAGTDHAHRWQANSSSALRLYGALMNSAWSTSHLELHGYGIMKLSD